MRDQITEAIERHQTAMDGLIALLDAVDGDPDAEPSLAGQDGMWDSTNQETWASGNTDEREGDHDEREPDVDDEPSLGWPGGIDQERAHKNYRISNEYGVDREAEHDGREPEEDAEHDGMEPEDFV